jgi:hypothetical protein
MIKRIVAYCIIALGFLVYIFFYKYTGSLIPYPFLFWLLGLGLIISGYALLRRSKRAGKQKALESVHQTIIDLKSTGEKIIVEFDKCELKENDYSEEVDRYTSSIWAPSYYSNLQLLNAMDDPMQNVEIVEVNQAVLVFQQEKNGKTEKFISPILKNEPTTLRFKLAMKKQTVLYVDKLDRSKYYFDLEFLNQ